MKHTIQRMLIAIALLVMAPSCAGAIAAIPKVAAVLQDASAVLQIIDSGAQEFFRARPDVDPEVRERYVQLYTGAVSALSAANKALAGAQNVDQKQYDQAIANFRDAFEVLRQFLAQQGILAGNSLKAGREQTVDIPTPEAIGYQVQ